MITQLARELSMRGRPVADGVAWPIPSISGAHAYDSIPLDRGTSRWEYFCSVANTIHYICTILLAASASFMAMPMQQANHTMYHRAIIIIPYRHIYNYVLGAVVRIVHIMLMYLSLLVPVYLLLYGYTWRKCKQLDTSDLTDSQQPSHGKMLFPSRK